MKLQTRTVWTAHGQIVLAAGSCSTILPTKPRPTHRQIKREQAIYRKTGKRGKYLTYGHMWRPVGYDMLNALVLSKVPRPLDATCRFACVVMMPETKHGKPPKGNHGGGDWDNYYKALLDTAKTYGCINDDNPYYHRGPALLPWVHNAPFCPFDEQYVWLESGIYMVPHGAPWSLHWAIVQDSYAPSARGITSEYNRDQLRRFLEAAGVPS